MVSFLLKGGEDPPPYPQKGTLESAGWDLFFPADVFLNPGEKKKVDLHVQVLLPAGTFGLLMLRSHVAFFYDLQLLGCVIGEPVCLFDTQTHVQTN